VSDIPANQRKFWLHSGKAQAAIVLICSLTIVAAGIVYRNRAHASLVQLATQQALPIVKIIHPTSLNGNIDLVLPGTLQAYYSATVYSRVTGYLKKWTVDIGTQVKSGQLLATIETPELDQQLKQSQANLESARANLRLTEITSRRWQNLLKSDSVSRQEADEKNGDYEAKKALVSAAQADVDRLLALASFKQITAPFDGIVTSRKTDIGALINAGHDAGHELFTVDDVHTLRLYVDVPQNYAQQIKAGMTAQLEIPELPGQRFDAKLAANSRAVNTGTGTMLIELLVDNADRTLLPGAYGNVHFSAPSAANQLQIPVTALVFRKEGMTVATLNADNRVQFRVIQIGQDLGSAVQVVSGLLASERIIDSPPDALEQGDQVRLAEGSHS